MKLIGSRIEREIRASLSASWDSMQREGTFLSTIQRFVPEVESAFILGWTPDQFEDFFTVLVNGEVVLFLEVDRETKAVIEHSMVPLRQYQHNLRYKTVKITLQIAIELSSEGNRTVLPSKLGQPLV